MESTEPETPVHSQKVVNQRLRGYETEKKTGQHLEAAAKNHFAAAKHRQAGNEELAAQNILKAQGHLIIAAELQQRNIKHQLLVSNIQIT